ncbi:hypothetical protein [Nonomuraea mesophila]|nr:hypothetical protein [Nonomuraea mesophila]
MTDGLWLRVWPHQTAARPRDEPLDDDGGEQPGRIPGWIDEAN